MAILISVVPALSAWPAEKVPNPGARVFKATLFVAGSGRTRPIFNYLRTERPIPGGSTQIEASFTEAGGAPAVTERALVRGPIPLDYRFEQHQTGESGRIEVRDGIVRYTFRDSKGRVHEDTEDYEEGFVAGPSILSYMRWKWKEIVAGETVPLRLGVADRQESFGFEVSLEKGQTGSGPVRVLLRPTSFFIRFFVSPIVFVFERETGRLLESRGRTFLKRAKGEDCEKTEFETVFH